MILERLTLSDFRAYGGHHVIDLAPRIRYGSVRPITLFGGLNGAGKTTLMMALKLALYGRHALGLGTSTTVYHRFLRESMHRSTGVRLPSHNAFVEVDFVYGRLGERSRFTVRRSWSADGRRVREHLSVSEDGEPLTLAPEACQGFLDDLVPISVSELFFFDGEKIAELAEDETGRILGGALQRLFGLHLVERLRGDLRVYTLRQENGAGLQLGEEIERLEGEYQERLKAIQDAQAAVDCAERRYQALTEERGRLELRLRERGGDWGASRESWHAKAEDLRSMIEKEERGLRDELAGIYPLSLSGDVLGPALEAAATTLKARTQAEANDLLASFAATLKDHLDGTGRTHVDRLLRDAVHPVADSETLLDVSHRSLGRMSQAVRHSIPDAQSRVTRLIERVQAAEEQLAAATAMCEQAPDDAAIMAEMDELGELSEQAASAAVELAVCKRELKTRYRLAIDQARTLRTKNAALAAMHDAAQSVEYAERTRRLLRDFHRVKTRRKIEELEDMFAMAFQELARKDDLVATARINPRNFTVKLLNGEGHELRKEQLSAGEKQIYAIAMLDALSRTSGRRLPVVIDTPLGRLDSQHRANLVSSYFPRASHQVILLSTDVEVDQPFYRELSPQVGRAYEIRYDPSEQTSKVLKGYFWRRRARITS